MGVGMNGGPPVPLMPTIRLLWCLFAQVVGLCLWTLPSHNPSGRGFDSHPPHQVTSVVSSFKIGSCRCCVGGHHDHIGRPTPQENHRRLDCAGAQASRPKSPRPAVTRVSLLGPALGHLWVAGAGHAVVANVGGVTPTGDQQCADSGLEALVDQESPSPPLRTSPIAEDVPYRSGARERRRFPRWRRFSSVQR